MSNNNNDSIACIECRKHHWKCDLVSSTKKRDCLSCRKRKVPCVVDRRPEKKKAAPENTKTKIVKYNSPANILERHADIDDLQPCTSSKTLNEVTLSARTLNDVFKLFYTHCYPYLPFKLSRNLEQMHKDSPLLFWVICSVTCPSDLYEELEPHVKLLLAQNLLVPFRNIETVHALLISSMWPIPEVLVNDDTAYSSSVIAKRLMMEAGLAPNEKPVRIKKFPEIDERTKDSTWHTCIFVGLFHCLRLGEHTDLGDDTTYQTNKNSHPFIRHACKIVHTAFIACKTLEVYLESDNVNPISVIGRTKKSAKELAITAKIVDISPKERTQLYIIFLLCRLHIYVYVLTEPYHMKPAVDLYPLAEKDAIDLIKMVEAKMEEHLLYAPVYITRAIVHAVLMLLWIKRTEYAKQKEESIKAIQTARRLLAKADRFEKEEYHKMMDILLDNPEELSESVNAEDTYTSILYQCLRGPFVVTSDDEDDEEVGDVAEFENDEEDEGDEDIEMPTEEMTIIDDDEDEILLDTPPVNPE